MDEGGDREVQPKGINSKYDEVVDTHAQLLFLQSSPFSPPLLSSLTLYSSLNFAATPFLPS